MTNTGGLTTLVSALFFAGYLLVYAAIAGGGKFATHPWSALLHDAYPAPVYAADPFDAALAKLPGKPSKLGPGPGTHELTPPGPGRATTPYQSGPIPKSALHAPAVRTR